MVSYINKESEYWHLFHAENRTQEQEQRFNDLCDEILLDLLEQNKDVFMRLKDR